MTKVRYTYNNGKTVVQDSLEDFRPDEPLTSFESLDVLPDGYQDTDVYRKTINKFLANNDFKGLEDYLKAQKITLSDSDRANLDIYKNDPKGNRLVIDYDFVTGKPVSATAATTVNDPYGANSFVSSAEQAATLGFADEIGAGLEAIKDAMFNGADLHSTYIKNREKIRAENRGMDADSPIASITGTIIGSLINPSKTIYKSIASGAASGYGYSDHNDSLADTAGNIATGAAIGGLAHAGTSAVAKAVTPKVKLNPLSRDIKAAGEYPTVGQRIGHGLDKVERFVAEKTPLIGAPIRGRLAAQKDAAVSNASNSAQKYILRDKTAEEAKDIIEEMDPSQMKFYEYIKDPVKNDLPPDFAAINPLKENDDLIRRLSNLNVKGYSTNPTAEIITGLGAVTHPQVTFPVLGGTAALYTKAGNKALDAYLNESPSAQRETISRLIKLSSSPINNEANKTTMGTTDDNNN